MSDEYTTGVRQRHSRRRSSDRDANRPSGALPFAALFVPQNERQTSYNDDGEYLTDNRTDMQRLLKSMEEMSAETKGMRAELKKIRAENKIRDEKRRAEDKIRDERMRRIENQNKGLKKKLVAVLENNLDLKKDVENLNQLLQSEREQSSETRRQLRQMTNKYYAILQENKQWAINNAELLKQVAAANGCRTEGKGWWKIALVVGMCVAVVGVGVGLYFCPAAIPAAQSTVRLMRSGLQLHVEAAAMLGGETALFGM